MTTSSVTDPASPALQSSPPLLAERVAFTGTLASMTHRQAAELCELNGGQATSHISNQTTLLVIGEEGWPLEATGRPSVKLEAAHELVERGLPLKIVSESEWLALLGLDDRVQQSRQLYTPAMLSQLLDVPVGRIRHWEQRGLIRAVKHVFRLPYFDFQEVTGARKLAELIASGVPVADLEAGLHRLKTLLPGIERPLAQLETLVHDRQLLVRDDAGLLESHTGQRIFDFSEESAKDRESISIPLPLSVGQERRGWHADDWIREGMLQLETGHVEVAIESFRRATLERPRDPVLHFHLADALYRSGNYAGAAERYYVAVENDHRYIEAWTQLGCVLAQIGMEEPARQAFEAALEIHPEYPDAHLHLAELLHQLGRQMLARPHWKRYLQYDQRGPWATMARERLGLDPQSGPLLTIGLHEEYDVESSEDVSEDIVVMMERPADPQIPLDATGEVIASND